MDKRTIIIICGITFLIFNGCGDIGLSPDKDYDPIDPMPAITPEYLQALWLASDHEDWVVVSGLVHPLTGGVVTGTPETWPEGYVFSVEIPPGALLPSGGVLEETSPFAMDKARSRGESGSVGERPPATRIYTPVLISIHVPRRYPGVPGNYDYPAVYRLEPHELEFSSRVKVTFCYPPWLDDSDNYQKFHFWREGGDPTWTYHHSDYELLEPGDEDTRTEIVFNTLHFSRWGLENGSGGGNGKSRPGSLSPPLR